MMGRGMEEVKRVRRDGIWGAVSISLPHVYSHLSAFVWRACGTNGADLRWMAVKFSGALAMAGCYTILQQKRHSVTECAAEPASNLWCK